MKRFFRPRLWVLLFGALATVSCSAAGGPVPTAPTSPLASKVTPLATLTSSSAPPAATVVLTQTLPPPTQTTQATQTATPAPTQTPTIIPTGISLDTSYPKLTGQNAYSAFVQYKDETGSSFTQTVHFLLFIPASYGKDPAKKWPLILYLHGSGNRGSNLNLVRQYLLPGKVDTTPDFPFIVLSPQCPSSFVDWNSQIDALNALLDLMIAGYRVDPQRIYATGFSMGGFGTWQFALRFPQRFAAISPVAGGYIFGSDAIPVNLCDLKNLPVWVFHGDQDKTVAPEQDISLINALRACGGNVRFTFYKGANHEGAASQAYADEQLYTWFAAQKKG